MWALRKSGVTFRTIVHRDGTHERWLQPKLAPWEIPRRDPAERRPTEVVAQRREMSRRSRERQRARIAAAHSCADADGGAAIHAVASDEARS
jgi:hypothetical protein